MGKKPRARIQYYYFIINNRIKTIIEWFLYLEIKFYLA